jgi:hypothetical protein
MVELVLRTTPSLAECNEARRIARLIVVFSWAVLLLWAERRRIHSAFSSRRVMESISTRVVL